MRSANPEGRDGVYFVRPRTGSPGEYILTVTYKGQPTHHLVKKEPNGNYSVNGKNTSTAHLSR